MRVLSTNEEDPFDRLIENALAQAHKGGDNYWLLKPGDYQSFKELLGLTDKEKIGFILFGVKLIHTSLKGVTSYSSNQKNFKKSHLTSAFIQQLLKTKFSLDEIDVLKLIEAFCSHQNGSWQGVSGWPIALFINQVEKNFRATQLPEVVKKALAKLKGEVERSNTYSRKELVKLADKIGHMIFASENEDTVVRPVQFLGEDQLAHYANPIIESLAKDAKPSWYKLLALCQSTSGAKPTAKFLELSHTLVKEIGSEKVKKVVVDWFEFTARMKEKEEQHIHNVQGRSYNYVTHEFLSDANIDMIKGLVWVCSHFHDAQTLQVIAALAEKSFKKIPGRGSAAAAVGNACLFTLFKSKGLDGIAHLSRLKLRIKQNSAQALIEKYLQEAASQQGVTVSEIEDLAVDDYGLVNGNREYEFDGYKLTLRIAGVGDVVQLWVKPDGSPQKSVPTTVKDKYKEKLAKIKNLAKQIELSTSAQRDRMDRMLRSERTMTWEYFEKHYFGHGLMSYITQGLVWRFQTDTTTFEGIYHDGAWRTNVGEKFSVDDQSKVSIWHPVSVELFGVRKWREYLIDEKIKQPIKQVFREVYFLTDAELNTRTYSNRMAAHILKQHQFSSLAKSRGWKYSLLGAYDNGRFNEGALLNLSEYRLRAEYWVNEVNVENGFNEAGIWNYVATDQVRFVNMDNEEPVSLIDIPKIPFSEIMRDVDLFVGVASVGNDPTWNDSGGVPAYRDYWHSYSFGELSEVAKNRKETLERLIPRLKISTKCTIKDRYLIVKGKLRTYKIHIGSTNILMEPNDQYLCIVPDRARKPTADNLFLPFEGDTGLSVVLSKAFLLAEDDKITDSTITSQINRR